VEILLNPRAAKRLLSLRRSRPFFELQTADGLPSSNLSSTFDAGEVFSQSPFAVATDFFRISRQALLMRIPSDRSAGRALFGFPEELFPQEIE